MNEVDKTAFIEAWAYRDIVIHAIVSKDKSKARQEVGKVLTVASPELGFLEDPNTKLYYSDETYDMYYIAVVDNKTIVVLEVLSYN